MPDRPDEIAEPVGAREDELFARQQQWSIERPGGDALSIN